MKHLNCCLLILGAAFCAVLFTGCSGGSSLGTEYVEGTVTLDGEPVAEATVMFMPVSEGEGASASGMTDENGVYKLTAQNVEGATAQGGGGTLPGEYHVGVIKTEMDEPMSEEEAYEKGIEYTPPGPEETPEITHIVPEKYNDPKQSGITVTVEPGDNAIDIKLTSGE